jgi:hypothetical protein
MKSIETQIADFREVCKNNGKESEASAIISESRPLEYKLDKLQALAKPFVGTDNSTMLVESFRRNFNLTESQARIAAGVENSQKNGSGYFGD